MRIVKHLTLGHSPDPDDAFMFYALATDKIDSRGWRFEHVLQDIQTLNDRALRCELDVTAISIHAYPYVADQYAMTRCGASMGDGYGPMIVSSSPMPVEDLRGKHIAVPGEKTTAFLVLNLFLGRGSFTHEVVMFDGIMDHVLAGKADAGLIIHEGQLTYSHRRLHCAADLGAWWKGTTGLPLPLGGNCIRRTLGEDAMNEISAIIRASIEYGLAHRDEAVAHAMRYARDMGRTLADRFVGMYVNEWTIDYGETGRRAVVELLRRGHDIGMVPALEHIDLVG